MKTKELFVAGALGSFLFQDYNPKFSGIAPSCASWKINISYNPENLFNVSPELSATELAALDRLQEVWGDDEDGAYETLFAQHNQFNADII